MVAGCAWTEESHSDNHHSCPVCHTPLVLVDIDGVTLLRCTNCEYEHWLYAEDEQ